MDIARRLVPTTTKNLRVAAILAAAIHAAAILVAVIPVAAIRVVVIRAVAIRAAVIRPAVSNAIRCAPLTATPFVLSMMIMVSVTGGRMFVRRIVRRNAIELWALMNGEVAI